jgi:hypothetical protein
MDKGVMFYITIGIIGIYFLTNFIGDIQEKDERIQNNDYTEKHRFDDYDGKDSIGQEILDLTDVSPSVQIEAWNQSLVKEEYLSLFPNFSEMKRFISDRIRGEAIQAKLLHALNSVEDKFFSGEISMEKAKRILRSLN